MVSHRRPGVLARALDLRRSPAGAIPAPRRVGIELVDARSGLRHLVSHEAMLDGYRKGVCRALCGALVLDREPHRSGTRLVPVVPCSRSSGWRLRAVMNGREVEIEAVCDIHPGSGVW